jgi:hypothetical protein
MGTPQPLDITNLVNNYITGKSTWTTRENLPVFVKTYLATGNSSSFVDNFNFQECKNTQVPNIPSLVSSDQIFSNPNTVSSIETYITDPYTKTDTLALILFPLVLKKRLAFVYAYYKFYEMLDKKNDSCKLNTENENKLKDIIKAMLLFNTTSSDIDAFVTSTNQNAFKSA